MIEFKSRFHFIFGRLVFLNIFGVPKLDYQASPTASGISGKMGGQHFTFQFVPPERKDHIFIHDILAAFQRLEYNTYKNSARVPVLAGEDGIGTRGEPCFLKENRIIKI